MTDSRLTLEQLPQLLRELDTGTSAEAISAEAISSSAISAEALALVDAEHAHWRVLHDRLIALISAFLDDAVEQGRPLQEVLDSVVARSSIGVKDLVGRSIQATAVAELLRAHGSTGVVEIEQDGATVFRHQCGTGLALWRKNPDVETIAAGEVEGVPGGVPRYCARCIHTISAFGDTWQVTPPPGPGPASFCTWTVREPVAGQPVSS